MSLFHLSTASIEKQVRLLLSELAERQHAGDADTIDVRFLRAAHVMGGMSFQPATDGPLVPDQIGHERAVLEHWLGVVPDLDSVTVIVRRYGKVVRSAVLEPDSLTRAGAASAPPCPDSEG